MFLNDSQSILVVAAHPDDEMLGCGGTLARLREQNVVIHILLLGEGPLSRLDAKNTSPDRERESQHAVSSACKAAAALHLPEPFFAGLPDNSFDTVPLIDIVKRIESIKHMVQPDIVFTHHAGDINIDHKITHQAAMTAFRPLPHERAVAILSFEVLSSTEYSPQVSGPVFAPTLYVDISDHLEAKQRALAAYASEMRPWPHPRSHEAVEHLARLRGSQCGKEAAEAFILCRGII